MPSPLQVQPGLNEPKAVAPQVSPSPRLSPEALKPHLEKVLAGIREASLQKNLGQFLAQYSPSFPELANQVLQISDAWQIYDYLSLESKLTEVKPLSEDMAMAQVTWNIETRNRSSKVQERFTQTDRTWFVKESGEWHIQNLEKAPPVKTPESYPHAYVAPEIIDLRENPGSEGKVVGQLYQGEQVALLPETRPGWHRVRSQHRGLSGWTQAESLRQQPVPIKYSYVSRESLPLRKDPKNDGSSLRLLYRGEQVQKVGKDVKGWCRVLEVKGHTLGWVPANAMSDRLVKQAQVKKQKSRIKRITRKAKTSRRSPPQETEEEEKDSETSEEPEED